MRGQQTSPAISENDREEVRPAGPVHAAIFGHTCTTEQESIRCQPYGLCCLRAQRRECRRVRGCASLHIVGGLRFAPPTLRIARAFGGYDTREGIGLPAKNALRLEMISAVAAVRVSGARPATCG